MSLLPFDSTDGAKTAERSHALAVNQVPVLASCRFPFRRDGFAHELIEQTGSVCLVARSKGGRQRHFEVVLLQMERSRSLPDGRIIPAHWRYPGNEEWGIAGWTHTDRPRARDRYGVEAQKQGVEDAGSINIAA